MPRPFPVPFRGRARGSAQGRRNAPQTCGGVGQIAIGGVGHAPPSLTAGVVRVCGTRPDDPNRASGEGRDGSDPPFLAAGAVRRVGGWGTRWGTGWGTHPPRQGGVAPVVCILAGRLPGPRAGRTISHTETRDA